MHRINDKLHRHRVETKVKLLKINEKRTVICIRYYQNLMDNNHNLTFRCKKAFNRIISHVENIPSLQLKQFTRAIRGNRVEKFFN